MLDSPLCISPKFLLPPSKKKEKISTWLTGYKVNGAPLLKKEEKNKKGSKENLDVYDVHKLLWSGIL